MNFEDILTLVKAGYTKEEISALTAGTEQKPAGTEQKPAGTEQKPTEQKPAETGQKPTAEQKPAETGQQGADLAGVLSKINETLAALQAAAITGDSRDSGATKLTAGQSLAKAITMTK